MIKNTKKWIWLLTSAIEELDVAEADKETIALYRKLWDILKVYDNKYDWSNEDAIYFVTKRNGELVDYESGKEIKQ